MVYLISCRIDKQQSGQDYPFQTPEGREIIKLHYQLSPVIVTAMEKDEEFKEEMKEMIDGVLGLVVEAE